jgi:hypothetical protein
MGQRKNAVKSLGGMVWDIFHVELPQNIDPETQAQIQAEIVAWMRTICTEQEQHILAGYYGLSGAPETLSHMADTCSRSRIGHVRQLGIKRMINDRHHAPVVKTIWNAVLQDLTHRGIHIDDRSALWSLVTLHAFNKGVIEKLQLQLAAARTLIPDHDVWRIPLFHELGLSYEIIARLRRAHVDNEMLLYTMSEEDFLLRNKLGKQTFRLVRSAFARHGIVWPRAI